MAAGTNYLHCAFVWEKTVLSERVFSTSSRITVGEGPRNTFAVQSPVLGDRHHLFRHSPKGTVLALKEGMQGKMRISGQTKEIEELTGAEAVARRKGPYVLYDLSEGDEGILVFGRTGLVFRLGPKTNQPAKAGVRELLDYNSMVSRFFFFALVAVLLSSFLTRLFAEPLSAFTVEHLPDRMVSLVVKDPEAAKAFRTELSRLKTKHKKPRRKNVSRSDRKGSNQKVKPHSPSKVAKRGMLGALVAARNTEGALRDVLGNGGLEMSLNRAVRELDRGAAKAKVLTSTGSGGILVPTLTPQRKSTSTLADQIQKTALATGATGRKLSRRNQLARRSETKVVVSMPSSAAETSGGNLSKKEIFEVVKHNQGAIRYCYESQLTRFPALQGELTADFIIDINGRVQKVNITQNQLSPSLAKNKVAQCLIRFISRWRFPKPRGGKVRVIYPFRFGQAK